MKGSNSKERVWENGDSNSENTDAELRPGGMLVQKREDEVDSRAPMVEIKVYHDSGQHDVVLPAKSTFRDLKLRLAQMIGLEPKEQRLLFRGKEKDDREYLRDAGVKDKSKVVLLEDPASRARKIEQRQRDEGIARACDAVDGVRQEVNKLVEQVNALESSVHSGSQVANQEFVVLIELLMRQLLKLDGIEAEGEAKVQRKNEVCRIQQYVEKLDALKAKPPVNPIPSGNSGNGTTISAQWQTFDSGRGEDDSTMMRDVATSSRVRPRDPSSYETEVNSSSSRRRRVHQMEPPRASHQLLTPDQMPSGSKLSFGVEPIVSEDLSVTSNACAVKITPPDIVTPQTKTTLPSNPSTTYWPSKPSTLGGMVPTTTPTALEPPPSVFDRLAMPKSSSLNAPLSHLETPTLVPEGVDYQSEIYYRYPSSPDPRNEDLHDNNLMFLRDVISRLTFGSPESLVSFTSDANAILDLLAHTGLDKGTLRYWEALCREAEFFIWQMKSLSISRTRASLSELHERVKVRREATNLAHGEFEKSSEAMRRHQQKSVDVGSKIDGLTIKLKDLWREYMSLLSRRTNLQVVQDREARAMEREQHRYHIKQCAITDADTALARAVNELQTAEVEYQTLATITTQLRDLENRFI